MPTGTGKSIVHAFFLKQALTQYPRTRVLSLTHVKELIEQNARKLFQAWSTAPVGINSAALDDRNFTAPIVLGGIASVRKNAADLGYRDLLIIDECHLLSPDDETMYQRLIGDMRQINPNLKVVGLTATPFRMGQGYLTNDGIFTDVCYDITNIDAFNELVKECYLCPLVPKATKAEVDLTGVRSSGGDYVLRELELAVDKESLLNSALDEAVELASTRVSWIVFGAGIHNAENICNKLNQRGIATTVVHSKISTESRNQRLEAFKGGHFQAIVSNNILTTGFDHPQVDCIVDLRPTQSIVLHVQKYGRGTRPYFHPSFSQSQLQTLDGRIAAIRAGGKANCLVLDFAGNTKRLGPINDPVVPRKKGEGTGEIPIKICDQCGAYNHISARFCIGCGAEFVFRTKLHRSAGTDEIIKESDPSVKIFPVMSITHNIHKPKNGNKPPMLRVNYFVAYNQCYSTFLNFEGIGFSKHKAREWWRQHSKEQEPENTQDAFNRFNTCRTANRIRVNLTGKYPEILDWYF